MKLRLYFIDKRGCHHIMYLMPSIKIAYEMKEKFNPHVLLEFLPEKYNQPEAKQGVILQIGDDYIHKNYTFEDPADKQELEGLIWHLLRKYNDIPDHADKDGVLRNFNKGRINTVIQGWKAKKRNFRKDRCCRVITDTITDSFMEHAVLHWWYRDSKQDVQTRDICMKVRGEECGDNYPPNTPTYRRCMREVEWLCRHGYPRNKRTEAVIARREKLKNKILEYLKRNKMKVNKRVLDVILSAGFFERVSNRVGNKYSKYQKSAANAFPLDNTVDSEYRSVKFAVEDTMNEYNLYDLIEGYDNGNNGVYQYGLIVMLVVLLILYWKYKI